ncbi:MAG TPA: MarR family winged helix-turn-helix transcriptional regulator [Bacteroidia bacterium]|jgi:DNA-binding MarR family transcriptional regulator|nr:MarR family winged helix-turn-helix transcriptional regulator [Bacteroidia bacterium]
MAKKFTETVDSKIKTTWQLISRMYNAEAVKHGGSIAIAHFLLNIDSTEGSYASDIAPLLGTESTSLSRIIKTLEEEKLIIRKNDKNDKRKVKIVLTEKGKKNKELAKQIVRNFNLLVENKIGKKELTLFFKILTDITELAEQQYKILKQS